MKYGVRQCYIIGMTTGIYCFENLVNGKKYIGQAVNLERRLREHEYYLERGVDKCAALQRAVSKYGRESFAVYILEYCTVEELNDREIHYVSTLRTNSRDCGYNIASGGRSGLIGHKFPPEFGQKMSAIKKEAAKNGWRLTEENKLKLWAASIGKIVSEETRRKISAGLSGEKHYMFGKKHTEVTKQKMSQSHSGEKAYQLGKKSPNSTSQYYGVFRLNQKGHVYWAAKVNHNGHRTYVGMSKDEIEAARMYDAYVIENNLPNPLNFPEEQ
jgi:group I intron endonuclease